MTKKVNHSLEMSITSKRPNTPTKGIFMLDSVCHIFYNSIISAPSAY